MTTLAYLSLGSNLGDRTGHLHVAVDRLADQMEVVAVSSLYETEPVGVTDQPKFVNLCLAVQTDVSPSEVLAIAKGVEREMGRSVTYRWGPREIDIDLLLYGDLIMETADLVIPHREMQDRAFVLVPLAEIAPEAMHPVLHKTVAELRDALRDARSVERIGSFAWDYQSAANNQTLE